MAWFREGVPSKEIATRLGRNVKSVQKIIAANRSQLAAASPLPKKRCGRPRLTDYRKDDRLRRHLLRNPFKTAKELKREVIGWNNFSVRTTQLVCQKRLELPSRCAAKKPLLTAQMVKKTIAFCKKHKNWTEDQWEDVMFTDESTFRLINLRAHTLDSNGK
jgi:hypothetical protein